MDHGLKITKANTLAIPVPQRILRVVILVPDIENMNIVHTVKDPSTTIVYYTALRNINLCNVIDAVSEHSRSKKRIVPGRSSSSQT